MLQKNLLLTLLLALLALACFSPQAKAGVYQLHVCDGVNTSTSPMSETWWSGSFSQWGQGSCGGDGGFWMVRWDSLNAMPSFSWGREGGAGYSLSTPSGTAFSAVALSSNVGSQGGGARCSGVFGSNGLLVDGSQNCRTPSFTWGYTGWQRRSVSGLSTSSVSILGFCTAGPCNIGAQGGFEAQIRDIVIDVTDESKPGLSNATGLVSATGWVRGVWPVGLDSSDGFGIKKNGAYLKGGENPEQQFCSLPEQNGIAYGSTLSPCPGSARSDFNINTASTGDGKTSIEVYALDVTSNKASSFYTVSIDNSAPSAPTITQKGETTQLTLASSDPQSGISDYYCKVDSGSYAKCAASFTPTLAEGSHNVCSKAANNSRDSGGAFNFSSETCKTVTVAAAKSPGSASKPSNPTTPAKPGGSTPSTPSDSNTGDGLVIQNTRQFSSRKATLVRTLVEVNDSGVVSQTIVNKYGKAATRCSLSQEVAGAGKYLLDCRLSRATHRQLRKRGMTVYLKTTFFADDNKVSRETDIFNLAKRR